MKLNKSGEKKHLGLSPSRHGIPGLKSLGRDGGEVKAVGELSGEMDAGADGPPSDEGSHGDASVLDLGVTVPGDGLVGSDRREAEGVPDLSEFDGVRLRKDGLAGKSGLQVGGADLVGGRGEGRGHAEQGKEDGGLHHG